MSTTIPLFPWRRLAAGAAACLAAACGEAPGPGAAQSPPELPAEHAALAQSAAMRSPTLLPDTVLATAGPHKVTAGDLDAAIIAMPSPDRLEYATSENIRELLESLIDRRLMAAAARAEGLDREPASPGTPAGAGAAPGASAEQALAAAWLAAELARLPPPSADEIERHYREHPADFAEPARVRVTRVVAPDEAAAERLRGELARGATLAELRAGIRDRATSAEELWLQDVARKPELTSVALGLRVGTTSPVLPVANGYAVLRAEERAGPRLRPLAEVRDGIRARLEDAARRDAIAGMRARLRSGVAIAIDEGRLASYLAPPAATS